MFVSKVRLGTHGVLFSNLTTALVFICWNSTVTTEMKCNALVDRLDQYRWSVISQLMF